MARIMTRQSPITPGASRWVPATNFDALSTSRSPYGVPSDAITSGHCSPSRRPETTEERHGYNGGRDRVGGLPGRSEAAPDTVQPARAAPATRTSYQNGKVPTHACPLFPVNGKPVSGTLSKSKILLRSKAPTILLLPLAFSLDKHVGPCAHGGLYKVPSPVGQFVGFAKRERVCSSRSDETGFCEVAQTMLDRFRTGSQPFSYSGGGRGAFSIQKK